MRKPRIKTGLGLDAHAFAENRALILGGVRIPYEKGLMGHSDADVLCHAISDALLGAAGLGDIGQHFPDTDPIYFGASSIMLMQCCVEKVRQTGYAVGNVDAVVIAQEPKIGPHTEHMTHHIAQALGIEPAQVNIKATTTEHMGFTGRKEGIAAQAVCLLERID